MKFGALDAGRMQLDMRLTFKDKYHENPSRIPAGGGLGHRPAGL